MKPINNSNECSTSTSPAIVSLNTRQVERLRSVLSQDVQIHGRENFPTLEVSLHTFIVNVRRKLREAGLPLNHVKVNGSAASYVFANTDQFPYSDIDLIFPLPLANDHDFDVVRQAVYDALLEMMPSTTNKEMITAETLRDIYINKMVKVTDGDRWSLLSLHNDYGRCIELKFVESMRRPFEFSVDSFQITLDPFIDNLAEKRPVIKAESMYGDFLQALYHLNKQLIDTRNPEEIRGGGLLKYCHLLTRGYSATQNCRDMEKYMCSRFFIDFPDIQAQEMKLHCYLQNHFGNEDQLKLDYLQMLYRVIRESTICLMSHERRQTLAMVDRLRQQLTYSMGLYFIPNGGYIPTVHYQPQQYRHRHNGGKRYNDRHYYNNNNNQYHPRRAETPSASMTTVTISSASSATTDESPSPVSSTDEQPYVPRQTLLYLPPNANYWIPVV